MGDHAEPIFPQSAVIPWRRREGRVEVLLITSRKRRRWVVPKGLVEPHLSPADSARAEAFEEAGIEGVVSPDPVGRYEYAKWGGICHVEVFLMAVERVLETWPEGFRERVWLPPADAAARLWEADLADLVRAVPLLLGDEGPDRA